MSQILCIIDGMTDPDFIPSLYPCLSSMERSGFVDTCQGQEPESLGCILRLLGIRHVPPYLRGYAEALGAGIPVGQQDLIMRGSWFGLDQQGCCTGPVPGPESLSVDCNCRYYHLESYKSLLVFPGLAREISKITTHPPYHCAGVPAVQMHPEGSAAAESLCRQCHTSRRCLIPWGQSIPASLPPFPVPAAVICGTQVVKGIARLLAMDLPVVPNATGDTDTDLHAKAAAALAAAEAYPFVLLHINGADEAAHRKAPQEKQAFLRQVDKVVLSRLLSSGHSIRVVADHGTDPVSGSHMDLPQPLFTRM